MAPNSAEMEFYPLKFRLLCIALLVIMCCFLEGGCALGVGILKKNRLHGGFLKKLRRSRITNSYVASLSKASYEEYNYTQVLDHFGYTPESYQTFPQRYFMDKSNWGGAQSNSPIFVFLGAEGDIAYDVGYVTIDQMTDFKALVVYIEHRYYGTSMPFGGMEAAYANASTRGYFTSTQVLADYATFIVYLKKTLKAENCPVVVFGASYGGMLAAWFRLKYPHITIGALAASAPILSLYDVAPTYGYDSVVTKDFRNVSDICYKRINESWAMMDEIASSPQGLLTLSKLFNTCENITDKESLYDDLESMYDGAAQYDFEEVKRICNAINSLPGDANTVSRIAAAANYSYEGQCLDLGPFNYTDDGWDWQTCTEMVLPFSDPPGMTMFPPSSFDIKSYSRECYLKYGVLPRQHWATIEFGGHDIKRVLKDFGSNIIFSNGLRDPWSSGGVLANISESIVAITTEEGTHCQDIVLSTGDDPAWLKEQKQKEIMIVQKWINDYKN
ncbi:hypothetical protein SUGI_0992590 [Cryptomeria japonica]|uniref:uncharacterized protein LOC131033270 n=1 Tax=Cryptomeria japonica TaxID=3369 RepID=UPI0024146DC2|nr:uncharacterized protein LOC131033270 [Cryptomeria japonica]GLJ47013.1 hypothetical protein SUGI_0992590 [Cryptomeria japonica]